MIDFPSSPIAKKPATKAKGRRSVIARNGEISPAPTSSRWQRRFDVSDGVQEMIKDITKSYQKEKSARNDRILRRFLIASQNSTIESLCTGKTKKEIRVLLEKMERSIKVNAPDLWRITCDYEERLYELAYFTKECNHFQEAMDAQIALRDELKNILDALEGLSTTS